MASAENVYPVIISALNLAQEQLQAEPTREMSIAVTKLEEAALWHNHNSRMQFERAQWEAEQAAKAAAEGNAGSVEGAPEQPELSLVGEPEGAEEEVEIPTEQGYGPGELNGPTPDPADPEGGEGA